MNNGTWPMNRTISARGGRQQQRHPEMWAWQLDLGASGAISGAIRLPVVDVDGGASLLSLGER